MSGARARVRIEAAEQEAERLRAAIDAWFARRRRADPLRQHRTQLATLEETLLGGLAQVDADIAAIAAVSQSAWSMNAAFVTSTG